MALSARVSFERRGTPRTLRFSHLIRDRKRVTSNEFDKVLAVRLCGWVAQGEENPQVD